MAVSRLSFCASRPLVPCGGCVGSWALSAGASFWVCGPPSRGRGTKGFTSLKDTAGRSKLAFSHHLSLLLIHKCCDPLLGCPLCMFHSGVALCVRLFGAVRGRSVARWSKSEMLSNESCPGRLFPHVVAPGALQSTQGPACNLRCT